MIIGVQRRQWLLLFAALTAPILLNIEAIWRDIGSTGIHQILSGTYKWFGLNYNPLPEILQNFLLNTIPLTFLAWLLVFLSNKPFFQKQRLVLRVFETLLTASLIAGAFAFVSGRLMPLGWLPKFHDYLLGLPLSPSMEEASRWVVFPITTIILFNAVFVFRGMHTIGNNS